MSNMDNAVEAGMRALGALWGKEPELYGSDVECVLDAALVVLHPTVVNSVEALEALPATSSDSVVIMGTSTEQKFFNVGSVFVATSDDGETWTSTGVDGFVSTDYIVANFGVQEWVVLHMADVV